VALKLVEKRFRVVGREESFCLLDNVCLLVAFSCSNGAVPLSIMTLRLMTLSTLYNNGTWYNGAQPYKTKHNGIEDNAT